MCFQKYLFETCNCYDITLPTTPKVQYSFIKNASVTSTQIDCMVNTRRFFYNEGDLARRCYIKCPVECNEIKYDLRVTSSKYPTHWYYQLLINNTYFSDVINKYFDFVIPTPPPKINYINDYEGLKNSIAKANIYYEDLSIVMIEEVNNFFKLIFFSSKKYSFIWLNSEPSNGD